MRQMAVLINPLAKVDSYWKAIHKVNEFSRENGHYETLLISKKNERKTGKSFRIALFELIRG